jgi:hypothetical protein
MATYDPTCGQGLSLTLCDARVLTDFLRATGMRRIQQLRQSSFANIVASGPAWATPE